MSDVQLELGARLYFKDTTSSFAPYLAGMWVDAIMLGCLFILCSNWAQRGYSSERLYTKILVIYLLIINTGISCNIFRCCVYQFASSFGVYRVFLDASSIRPFWLLNAASRIPAALFFTHRAYLLQGRGRKGIWVPLVNIPLLAASTGCAIGAYFTSITLPVLPNSPERILVVAFTCTELAADVINTVTIAVSLWNQKTGWSTTNRVISRLLVVLAETQLPPTIAALSFLLVFLLLPNNTIIALWQGTAKVHAICLVVVVNSRVNMLAGSMSEESHELPRSRSQVDVEATHDDKTRSTFSPKYSPKYSNSGADDQTRSANGRTLMAIKGEGSGDWQELHSKTSLI